MRPFSSETCIGTLGKYKIWRITKFQSAHEARRLARFSKDWIPLAFLVEAAIVAFKFREQKLGDVSGSIPGASN